MGCKEEDIFKLTGKEGVLQKILSECHIGIRILDEDIDSFSSKNDSLVKKIQQKFGQLPVGVYRPI